MTKELSSPASAAVPSTGRLLAVEGRLQNVGILFWVMALAMLMVGVMLAFIPTAEARLSRLMVALVLFAYAGGLYVVGNALWYRRSWSRGPATVLSVIGLFGFPLGTVANSVALWILWQPGVGRVLDESYERAVRPDGEVRPKPAGWWVVTAAFLTLVMITLICLTIAYFLLARWFGGAPA